MVGVRHDRWLPLRDAAMGPFRRVLQGGSRGRSWMPL